MEMDINKRDLIVIGSGPGGYVAAIRATQLGRQTTIIEKDSLGGVCLNWGCIPSKALLTSAQHYQEIKHAEHFGIMVDGLRLDFPAVVKRSRDVSEKLSKGVSYLMRKNEIEVIKGNASFVDNGTVEVVSGEEVQHYQYNDAIIATGGSPRLLPNVTVDGDLIHTSRTILELRRLPQKVLIIGAGAIGVEFAYLYSTFGAQVTLVEILDQILPIEDRESSQTVKGFLEKQGVIIKLGTALKALTKSGKTVSAIVTKADQEEQWSGDCCLLAIGITPNSSDIGLEKLGIELEKGFIKVDNQMRTSLPHHFAIGDVAGGPLLAHVASHEGIVAAEVAAGNFSNTISYDNIPSCTYCQPQVASIGLTEQAAQDKGLKYSIGKAPFSANGKAIAAGSDYGFLKVLVAENSGEILGVHIVHAEATELISAAALIRSHEGVAESVLETIHPHPTLSEAMAEAMAQALNRPINL